MYKLEESDKKYLLGYLKDMMDRLSAGEDVPPHLISYCRSRLLALDEVQKPEAPEGTAQRAAAKNFTPNHETSVKSLAEAIMAHIGEQPDFFAYRLALKVMDQVRSRLAASLEVHRKESNDLEDAICHLDQCLVETKSPTRSNVT
jgi:hypothetical protein